MSKLTLQLPELMRQMKAPREDGFNPIAPRSHRALMDAHHPEEVRVLAWVLWRTIDVDRSGRLGFKKLRRTSFAHDERGVLTVQHLADDLGLKPSNASAALKRAAERGVVWTDEKRRIFPNGNAPDPALIRKDEDLCTDIEEDGAYICTDISDEQLRLYFQQLPKIVRAQRVREYRDVLRYREQLKADAIAAARDAGERFEKEYLKSIGYVASESGRGRPKKPRPESAVQLSILRIPQLSVQIESADFVQKPPPQPYGYESGTVQINASLLSSTESTEYVVRGASGPVRDALNEYGRADDDAAERLLETCRAQAKDAQPEDVARMVREKGKVLEKRRDIVNPIGFLLSAVPKMFEKDEWRPQPKAAAARPAPVSRERQIESLEQLLAEFPNHSQAAEFRRELEELRNPHVLANGSGGRH